MVVIIIIIVVVMRGEDACDGTEGVWSDGPCDA